MIDVISAHTIHVGDNITVIGKGGDAAVTAEEPEELSDTISYEILCATGKRIPRLYLKGGGVIGVLTIG